MTPQEIASFAQTLEKARSEGREIERISSERPDFTLEDAYRIHDAAVQIRVENGEKIVGYKMGLTSEAKRKQMGLDSPIYGTLLDQMILKTERFSMDGSIHPKIEPEVAFYIERPLQGRVTLEEAMAACSGVCAAMEIIDSRYVGFKYFSLNDVVADNSSASRLVLSPKVRSPQDIDISDLPMVMTVDGAEVQSGSSNAISGNPWNSLIQLCELLHSRGLSLPARSIVIAGAATPAIPLVVGQFIEAKVEGLGSVSVEVVA